MELLFFILGVAVVLLMLNQRSGPGDSPASRSRPTVAKPTVAGPGKRFVTAKVRQVIDGDTVIVTVSGDVRRLRLKAIDAPEDGQEWGDIAKYGLIKLIGGRWIYFEDHGVDVHGRTLATVFVKRRGGDQWIDVNTRMVALGHAWVQRIYNQDMPRDRRAELHRLERWARRKKVGLWRSANPLPPWKWRHRGR